MSAPFTVIGTKYAHDVQCYSLLDLATAYERPVHPSNAGGSNETHTDPATMSHMGTYWHNGVTSKAIARDLMERGWNDGARRLTDLSRDITPPTVRTRRRKQTWRDEGDDLSVDRALSGQWDTAWRTSRRTWVAGPGTVTLVTSWGGNCNLGSDQLFWQGAACTVLADALESAGYAVRIVAATTTISNAVQRKATTFITIKEESEPMRIDAAASMLCHAGIFRSYGLRAMCELPFDIGMGHGRCEYGWPEDTITALKALDQWPDDAIVLGKAHNRQDCIDEIDRVLALVAG